MNDIDMLETQKAKLLFAIGQNTVLVREAKAAIEHAHETLKNTEAQIASLRSQKEEENGERADEE